MQRADVYKNLKNILLDHIQIHENGNFLYLSESAEEEDQNSTNSAFSSKWTGYKESEEKERLFAMQSKWYLELYGFSTEDEFATFLKDKKYIFDAGSGMGNKAAWMARLAPHALVIAMDFSASARIAAHNYADIPNLFFIQGDIAKPTFREGVIDYVSCDQVIMHTQDPEKTFAELRRVTAPTGQFACYFYAKKALPRELLDDYFRAQCKNMTHDEIMEMSRQITEFGKRLSDLNVKVDAPEIPALGIKGGLIDVQRLIYWNFMKCYWTEDLGRETSDLVNFDWYSPSNARRYSREEVESIVNDNNMNVVSFHVEEACYSGRFAKKSA